MLSRAVTEEVDPEAWAETMADGVLRREVRLVERVERAEGEECMAVEAPLML